jgi:TIR domain
MIFISYSIIDKHEVGKLKESLEAEGYECFLAHDDIHAMADWQAEIERALLKCHTFLGYVTENFNKSAFCQQEVGIAYALKKPRLLIKTGAPVLGFLARFQAIPLGNLMPTLSERPQFQETRIEAWIYAVTQAATYAQANSYHDTFHGEWDHMNNDQKLRWFRNAAANSQVRNEWKAGKFYDGVKAELKPLLTDQWLFDNDKEGRLHDFESNPIRIGTPPTLPVARDELEDRIAKLENARPMPGDVGGY